MVEEIFVENSKEQFVKVLREARTGLNLTHAELAEKLHIPTPQVIRLFEEGRRRVPLELLPDYANAVGLDPKTFICSWLRSYYPAVAMIICRAA